MIMNREIVKRLAIQLFGDRVVYHLDKDELHTFALAIIENYKSGLVPVAHIDVNNRKLLFTNLFDFSNLALSAHYPNVQLYALPPQNDRGNKMKFEIKHRRTENVLYACDAENLKDAVIEAVGKKADLSDADLRDADLRGADLRDADLRGADLRDAYLGGADLRDADLRGADLRDADLRGADLRDAYLRDANLGGANLGDANLSDANLGGANLSGANLSDAYLRDAYLGDANLGGANLRDAYLRGEKIAIVPISILNLTWDILISESYLKIGCQRHTHDEWKAFTDDGIAKMEGRASSFWSANKSWLLSACKAHRKESLAYRKANPIEDKP
jgi:uncharacterized protein YjbI with pentapeptide repeats